MTIRPVPTRYAGCRFRSRLEARWAVFFDTLGITWEYEPQGYEVQPDGPGPDELYLPDFWLPQQRTFFEVKGQAPEDAYRDMLMRFSTQAGTPLILAVGSIPDPATYEVKEEMTADGKLWMDLYNDGFDNYRAWCSCIGGKHYDLHFMGLGNRIRCACGPAADRFNSHDDPKILSAYGAARSARFEHGESGA